MQALRIERARQGLDPEVGEQRMRVYDARTGDLKFAKKPYRVRDPNSAISLGMAAKRAGLTVSDIERLGQSNG